MLGSRAIWLCASCEACTTRCPMGIDMAAVMDALRMMAVERKAALPDRPRQGVQPQLPRQRAAPRPRVRAGHDGRLQAPHRSTCFRRGQGARRCWPRASSRCCPSAAAARRQSARCSAGRKRAGGRTIVKYAFFPGAASNRPRGTSTGRPGPCSPRLGIELEDIPGWVCCGSTPAHRQQCLAGRGAAGVESAEGPGHGPARDDGLRLVLRPAAHGQPQGSQRPARARACRTAHRQALRRQRRGPPRARRAGQRLGLDAIRAAVVRPLEGCESPATTAACSRARRRSSRSTTPSTRRRWTT